MVKSRYVSLLACTAAVAAMAGCSPAPQPQAQYAAAPPPQPVSAHPYSSIAECQSDANNPNPQLCQASFNASVAALPHYSGLTACEMQYGAGACQNHGDFWGPALAGFMLGSMMNGSYHYYPPMYVNHGYVWSNGRSMGYAPTRVYVHGAYVYGTPRATVVHVYAPAAPTVTRGGFGGNQAVNSVNTARPAANVATHTVVATTRPSYTSTVSSSTSRGGFGGGSGGGGFHSSGGGGFHSSGGGGGFS